MRFGCYEDSIPSDDLIVVGLGTESKLLNLGIIVDRNIRWEEYVLYLVKKPTFYFQKIKRFSNPLQLMRLLREGGGGI